MFPPKFQALHYAVFQVALGCLIRSSRVFGTVAGPGPETGESSPMDLPLHAGLLLLDERRRGLLRNLTRRRFRRGVNESIRGSQEVDSGLHRVAQRKGGEASQING